jgi:hypothetical protein
MTPTIASLLRRISDTDLLNASVIPWSCPVPSFGDPQSAVVATLGLNPSNREFVDNEGRELCDGRRRFHTLRSLGLCTWSDATLPHVRKIADACRRYFLGNPYDLWFQRLNYLLGDTPASYYGSNARACHLDLVPYATSRKWMELSLLERRTLLDVSGDALATLLKGSPIRLIILNGRSVVEHFEAVAGATLKVVPVAEWTLPRRSGNGIAGLAYSGTLTNIAGVRLKCPLTVLGFNHNIQSSFGVTKVVIESIRRWIGETAAPALA